MALADDPVCGYVWGACYASAIRAYARTSLLPDSANEAVADFQRRYAPLRGNKWFDAALARLGDPI